MFKWFGFVTEIYLLFIKYSSKVINGCIRFHKPFSFFFFMLAVMLMFIKGDFVF